MVLADVGGDRLLALARRMVALLGADTLRRLRGYLGDRADDRPDVFDIGLPRHFLAGFGWALLAFVVLTPAMFVLLRRKGYSRSLAGIGPAKKELVDAIGSIQAVIELANDVETLIRAGESLPKPFVERFSKYKNDAPKMKRRLLSHARPTETSDQRD